MLRLIQIYILMVVNKNRFALIVGDDCHSIVYVTGSDVMGQIEYVIGIVLNKQNLPERYFNPNMYAIRAASAKEAREALQDQSWYFTEAHDKHKKVSKAFSDLQKKSKKSTKRKPRQKQQYVQRHKSTRTAA